MSWPLAGDEHLLRCWRHQDCHSCLDADQCSWCPFVSLFSRQYRKFPLLTIVLKSWSCVPNNHTIPALAPAYDENICPHWAERWEVRTRPLGCQVSTITSLSSIVSIVSTLIFIAIVSLMVLVAKKLRAYHKMQQLGWWRFWRWDWTAWTRRSNPRSGEDEYRPAEREPLLRTRSPNPI